jgi:putative oxidoreductase
MIQGVLRYESEAYAVMRMAIGFMFWCHGLQKVFGVFEGRLPPLLSASGIAGIIELVTGFMIAVGLFGGWAAFLSSGLMACAYFMVHFGKSFWPIENDGELAAVYCFIFLYMARRGSGIWSLDGALKRASESSLSNRLLARALRAAAAKFPNGQF